MTKETHIRDTETIAIVADRAAGILAGWLDLAPLAKADIGGTGMQVMLLARLHAETPAPPPDVRGRLSGYLARLITVHVERTQACNIWLKTDYGPGPEIAKLAEECGIEASFPDKSSLSIDLCAVGWVISAAKGYGARNWLAYLTPRGWLVSPVGLDKVLMPIVLRAVERGEADAAFRLEPAAASSEETDAQETT